jgi:hypothetical protein
VRPPIARLAALLALTVAIALVALQPRSARAFGDAGAFDPRVLITGSQTGPAHATAPGRWAWELEQRTSAPARLHPSVVRADDPAVVGAPFLYWSGDGDLAPLSTEEIAGLRRFFASTERRAPSAGLRAAKSPECCPMGRRSRSAPTT